MKEMNVIVYARVSSQSQDLDLQIKEIKRFCDYRNCSIIRLFTDKTSGKNLDRPGFKQLIDVLDTNTLGIDAVVIHKLDRIGRSLGDLIKLFDWFKSKNIQVISILDNIDTSTPQGVLFFHLMGAMAEYERHLINERTYLGRKEALANGVKFGRHVIKIPMDLVKKDIALGIPKSVICKKYGIKRSTLYAKMEEEKHKHDFIKYSIISNKPPFDDI